MGKISAKELCGKYNFNYHRLLRWLKRGYVKGEKKPKTILHKVRGGKIVKQEVIIWYVDEDSFLEIPAFVRRNYSGRRNFKSLKKEKYGSYNH